MLPKCLQMEGEARWRSRFGSTYKVPISYGKNIPAVNYGTENRNKTKITVNKWLTGVIYGVIYGFVIYGVLP